jgi:2-keto-4-pentenoate hydratase/2-oxohepta-3-ene-1,7-dioic acid hydratase in catechol pathway
MKICHYNANQAGAVVGDKVYPVGEALVKAGHVKADYTMVDIVDALANKAGAMQCAQDCTKSGSWVPLASVKLLPSISNPPSLWAAASNYRAHQAEMRDKMASVDRTQFSKDDLMAEFFLKPSSALIGPGDTVVLPKFAIDVDFECELCAVIGKKAKHVTEDKALDIVFGYTICWDLSQREPWGKGRNNTRIVRKAWDTFTALGPWIVTKDEIPEPQDLKINVEQNGAHVMTAHTSDMICGLRDHIRFLTMGVTLRPGDLITTGTPAGVRKLRDGDHLKGSIERIGEMDLNVRNEA